MSHQSRKFVGSFALAWAVALGLLASGRALADDSSGRLAAREAKGPGVVVTFSGFRSSPGGGGVVFVELTESIPVEVNRAGQVIEYKLVGAKVPLRNNRNPLLLRDFGASALSAVLIQDKNAVRLVITLRGTVNPTHRMLARGKGAALEVELPPVGTR